MPEGKSSKREMMPREQLRQIATGFVLSRSVAVAAELKIADTLKNESKTALEIAEELKLNKDSLYRFLRFLSCNGVFSENTNEQFSLTPLSEIMVSDASGSMHAYLDMLADDPPWDSVGNMIHTIKTGEPSFQYKYGEGFFDYMAKHPDSNARFNAGMSSFSSPDNLSIINAYDFSRYNLVVDIGGGQGSFLASILSEYTEINGVLYDQPEIVSNPIEEITKKLSARCKILGGDFFSSVPNGGDIYILKLILHDWGDAEAIRILRNCSSVVPVNGKVLVIDGVMLGGNEYDPHKQLDISMMLIFGGRERSRREFMKLFEQAGLRITQIIPTLSRLSIIESEKI